MRHNRRVYPDPPHSMTRREAALLRRAQTYSLMTPHIEHYVQGKDGSPSCVACGGFPDNSHVLWNCPGGHAAMGESLKHIPYQTKTCDPGGVAGLLPRHHEGTPQTFDTSRPV
ncbi:hypothetical protein HPB50_018289 [Hyalomma asiaticum]|uniref:Uncharacterized protein n=1 Tax=Hyalomma asiaticum TaxID=266040 RepID=A0ACB7SXM2_HYAAI|nr:hypothetical protein HPB50_018289 [Hyalomma asiaticum]